VASQYQWYLSVVASSNGDFSPNYVAPDGTGGFKTTTQRPPFDTVQVISVFVQDTFTNAISNALNITVSLFEQQVSSPFRHVVVVQFVLRTCQLKITGPSSFQICNSLAPVTTIPGASYQVNKAKHDTPAARTRQFSNPSSIQNPEHHWPYTLTLSRLPTQIVPAPPGPGTTVAATTIVWDDPVLISSTNGDTINYLQAQQGGTFQIPAAVTTHPSISEVQVYEFTASDTAAGSNYIPASRLITVRESVPPTKTQIRITNFAEFKVILNAGCWCLVAPPSPPKSSATLQEIIIPKNVNFEEKKN
jgi:hypothetical protein